MPNRGRRTVRKQLVTLSRHSGGSRSFTPPAAAAAADDDDDDGDDDDGSGTIGGSLRGLGAAGNTMDGSRTAAVAGSRPLLLMAAERGCHHSESITLKAKLIPTASVCLRMKVQLG